MGRFDEVVEVSFERLETASDRRGFAVARVSRSAMSSRSPSIGRRVLVPSAAGGATTCTVEVSRCIPLHEGLSPRLALLVPDLALAMAICDAVQLELGEAAVYTSGAPHGSFVAKVAQWRTCRDVICLDMHDGAGSCPAGVQQVDGSDPQRALEIIHRTARRAPGFAAVVLTQKSEALDVLLEAMPTWGRLVIASASTESATIDFYNNVHRKGVKVVSAPASSSCIFDVERQSYVLSFVARAMRVLLREDMATTCVSNVN